MDTTERIEIDKDQELMNMLEIPPYGDSRALFLRSRYDLKVFLESRYNLKVFDRDETLKLLGGVDKVPESMPDFVGVP